MKVKIWIWSHESWGLGGETPHPTKIHWSIIKKVIAGSFFQYLFFGWFDHLVTLFFLHSPDSWYMKKAANNQEVAQQAVTLFLGPGTIRFFDTQNLPHWRNTQKNLNQNRRLPTSLNADRCLLVGIHEKKKTKQPHLRNNLVGYRLPCVLLRHSLRSVGYFFVGKTPNSTASFSHAATRMQHLGGRFVQCAKGWSN